MPGKLWLTCGNCQLVCHPGREERKRRYKMLVESGVVVQHPDGSLEAKSGEDGELFVAKMDTGTRSLYEK